MFQSGTNAGSRDPLSQQPGLSISDRSETAGMGTMVVPQAHLPQAASCRMHVQASSLPLDGLA